LQAAAAPWRVGSATGLEHQATIPLTVAGGSGPLAGRIRYWFLLSVFLIILLLIILFIVFIRKAGACLKIFFLHVKTFFMI
jgi:hypothetical protein